jgi:hypothetical protein
VPGRLQSGHVALDGPARDAEGTCQVVVGGGRALFVGLGQQALQDVPAAVVRPGDEVVVRGSDRPLNWNKIRLSQRPTQGRSLPG